MISADLIPFVIACLAIEATPGPNMAYLAVLSVTEGRRTGLFAVAGVALGLLLIGLAAGMGIAAVVTAYPLAYNLLRFGGVAYLLWLAWESWREAVVKEEAAITNDKSREMIFFRRGLITNLLNPKAAVFYIAMLPSFIDGAAPPLPQTIALTLIYVIIATTVHSLIVTLGGTAKPFFEDPARQRRVRRVFSLLLVLIALWFALSTGQM